MIENINHLPMIDEVTVRSGWEDACSIRSGSQETILKTNENLRGKG